MDRNAKEKFEQRVRTLEAFGHRGSATEREGRAADYLVEELRKSNVEAEKEEFRGFTSLGMRVLIHVAFATIGICFLWAEPLVTLLLGIVVLISFVGEMNTRLLLLSRLLPKAGSRNVVGRIPASNGKDPVHRVILCAHLDTQRTGLIWREQVIGPMAGLLQKAPGPVKSPTFLVVLAFAIQPFIAILEQLWAGNPLTIAGFYFVLVVYVIAGFLLAEWSTGQFVPGASDNATGVAAAIALGECWNDSSTPSDVELVILLTGCEEVGALGAAAWLDAHKGQLKTSEKSFLVLDTLGYGGPRFVGKEYTLAAVPVSYPQEILKMCHNVAQRLELTRAGPHTIPNFSDSIAFLSRGIPGAFIATFKDDGVHMPSLPNLHQMSDTSSEMSFDVGWQATQFGWEMLKELAAYRR